jgi:DNA-binding IclR family transcriptional regulator
MSDSPKADAQRGSQTLARGLSILGALRDKPNGYSVAELGRLLGLPRAVVTRLLATLEDARYVERTDARSYRLGPELVALGRAVRSDLKDVAVSVLQELAEDVGATVVLVVRNAAHAVVISVVEPVHTDLRLLFRLGSRHLLEQGAEGMAILAGNDPLPGERREVTDARRSGYVVTAGEIMPGTWGLAAPVMVQGRHCEMSIGVIAAQALEESKIAHRVIIATRDLADRLGLTGELH